MNIESLKAAWNASVSTPAQSGATERMARETRERVLAGDRATLLRQVYGTAAFVLALGMLAVLAAIPGLWLGMRVALGLWAIAIIACLVGMWRIRDRNRMRPDSPLDQYLQARLQRLRREIAYQQSLRWRWWLPSGVGVLAAVIGRMPVTPDVSWLLVAACAGFWIWGGIQGPRHWPRRLQPEADALQTVLDDLSGSPQNHISRGEPA